MKNESLITKLKVEILDSNTMKKGTTIDIGPSGLEGSKRNKNDGFTYFGTEAGAKDKIINDYIIPKEEAGFGKRHFLIKYDPENRKYFLKDIPEGSGTFIKIPQKMLLKQNNVISFGEYHFATIFPPEYENKAIQIKFLGEYKPFDTKTYYVKDLPITIGRHEGSVISIPTGGLSRHQCKY